MNTKTAGMEGEDRAAAFLRGNNYKIICRNWRTREGEIDIIACKGDTIIFVEVKNFPHTPFEEIGRVIGKAKQKKIIETSKHFLNSYREYNSMYIRYDVVVIGKDESHLEHIPAAFSESL